MEDATDLESLADWVLRSALQLKPADRRLGRILHQELLLGSPVELKRLATLAGLDQATVADFARRWARQSEEGLVYAFLGLTLQRTKHRLTIRGRDFYAWCAWDTLFLPELLGEPVAIESSCPVAGTSILLRVSPEGIEFIDPPGAMVTFVTPPDLCCDIDGCEVEPETLKERTLTEFCALVHFFSTPEAARQWAEGRADTHLLSVDEAFEVGRRTNRALFGVGTA